MLSHHLSRENELKPWTGWPASTSCEW